MKRLLPLLAVLMAGCSEAGTVQTQTYGKSVMFPSEDRIDTIFLSPMNEGESVRTGFMVQNRSGHEIGIYRIESGCGCTSATWNRESIPDGRDAAVTLTFNSSGQFGKQFKTIEVITEDGEVGRIHLAADVKF